jgi:hypothetical protein
MKFRNDEEGSVEAGLTFIPTTAFFLLLLQLVVAGSVKTIETMNLQSWINKSALYAIDGEVSREIVTTSLPGGGELLTLKDSTSVPEISSFTSALTHKEALNVTSEALAIRE